MRYLLVMLIVLALAGTVLAGTVLAETVLAGQVGADRTSVQAIRAVVGEAQLQLSACNWTAAERVLKGLRQQLMLEPGSDPVRTRLEFVIWDLRMGLHDQAAKDLAALDKTLVSAPE